MLRENYITRAQYAKAAISRTVISVVPGNLRKLVYDRILRK